MRNRWLYCFVGAVPFWIWTYLDFRARRAEPARWVFPDDPGTIVDAATWTAVILTGAGVVMLFVDVNKRRNL